MEWAPVPSVAGVNQRPWEDAHERIGRVQEGAGGDFGGEMTDAEREEIDLDPRAEDQEETEVEEGSEAEGTEAETGEETEADLGSRRGRQKKGSAKTAKTRSASAHPQYAIWLKKTSRRSRSIVMTRYPMAGPEEEAEAVQMAWERETRGSVYEGKPFPDEFDLIVGVLP